MKRRWLWLAGGFWVLMNALLWRAEYGGGARGNPLPVSNVLSRIMETPDPSELDIYLGQEKWGSCRWMVVQVGQEGPSPGEASATLADQEVDLEAAEMSGLIRDITAFTISLDGYLQWEDRPRGIRFMLQLEMTPARDWVALDGKVGMLGTWLHLHADQKSEQFTVELDQDGSRTAFEWGLQELKDPRQWVQKLSDQGVLPPLVLPLLMGALDWIPSLPEALSDSGVSSASSLAHSPDLSSNAEGATWSAFSDWLNVAHSRLRIYRLEGPYGEALPFQVTVNRAGEILLVELPRGLKLSNQSVLGL